MNSKDAPGRGTVGRREFLQAAAMVSGASAALSSLEAAPAISEAGSSGSGDPIYLTDLERCRPASALFPANHGEIAGDSWTTRPID